jgi:hypothetical protein
MKMAMIMLTKTMKIMTLTMSNISIKLLALMKKFFNSNATSLKFTLN